MHATEGMIGLLIASTSEPLGISKLEGGGDEYQPQEISGHFT